ncbi:MAG: hypothetical protein KDD35_09805, partial [Bdellovibrionales bacterium]|nr:hypothetical protein [Bdellovibrionales bacterium]
VWKILAPSAIPFAEGYQTPMEMGQNELDLVVEQFVQAAERSFRAGFKVLEIHMAHGYLLHEFLSPLSNRRSDEYGGIRKGRMAFPLRVVQSVREVWPLSLPLFVRISATDWRDQDGWSLDDSVELSHQLKQGGVDLIDCSSGGNSFQAEIPFEPGYQVRFAEEIRRECDILTGAVGLITQAHQAEQILIEGKADAVLLGRELLRDPYWPLHAARELGLKTEWPLPYQRA